jgi:hypothetical protein
MMAKRPSNTTKMAGGVDFVGLRSTLRAFSQLDKDAQNAARDEVQKVANMLAHEVTRAGIGSRDPRNRHVARSIRGTRERTPVIKIGNAVRLPVSRGGTGPRASDLMFGMEFGSSGQGAAVDLPTRRGGAKGWRFPPRTAQMGTGSEGYWIYPTIRRQQPKVVKLWADALDRAAADWAK